VAPFALRHLLEHEGVLHEHTVILSWQVEDQPSAPAHETSVRTQHIGDHYDGLVALAVTLGYRDRLDVENVLARAAEQEPEVLNDVDTSTATFFVSDPIPRLTSHGHLPIWQQRLFIALDRVATDRVEQLALPRERSVVLGREFTM
jgi:KUP system potassium uptake protein